MTEIRLAPSGPVIQNATGGPLDFGPGARLRLAESQIVLGGSTAILEQSDPAAEQVISEDGFGSPAIANPLIVQLGLPKPGLSYRANLRVDVINLDTSSIGDVLLLLDTSIDGGTNWVNQIQTDHRLFPNAVVVGETTIPGNSLQCQVTLPTTLGAALGVVAGTPSLMVRVRAQRFDDTNPLLVVWSPASVGELGPLDGSCWLWLEEVF